jgi:hypothetical protein
VQPAVWAIRRTVAASSPSAAMTRQAASTDRAAVGVFAFVGGDGRPRACAVTPYLDGDHALVTSTLAFTAKVAAVRRDPRIALLAGGCLIRGRAAVEVDLTSVTFDQRVREQELRKYPPARVLLAIPGHRRLLWWYVGRASITIPLDDSATAANGSDRITVSFLNAGLPRIVPLDPGTDVSEDQIEVPGVPDGAACLLAHDEDARLAELRQLTLHGTVRDSVFRVERRTGSLEPTHPGTLDQLRSLRTLGRAARKNRPILARWAEHDDQASWSKPCSIA